jgi:hypothetical protein
MQRENLMTQKVLLNEIGDGQVEHPVNLQQGILRTVDELMTPEMNQNAHEPFEQRQFKKKKRLGQRL